MLESGGDGGPCPSVGAALREGRFLRLERVYACLASDLISVRNENAARKLLSGRNCAREQVHPVTRSL